MENRIRPDRAVSGDEAFHFTMMLDACGMDDPHSALTNLIVWLGIWRQMHGSSSSDRFASKVGGHPLAEEIKVLREARVSDLKDWSGATLKVAVINTRCRLLLGVTPQSRKSREIVAEKSDDCRGSF